MSDEQKQGQPGENPERDVADLLEQAESLSNELGVEVGAEAVPPTEREKEFFESETDSEASLDLQIAQAETALESAKSEITDTPPPAKKISLPPRKKAGAASGGGEFSPSPEASPRSEEPPVSDGGTQESGPSATAGGSSDRTNAQVEPPTGDGVATATVAQKDPQVENLVAARIEATPYEFDPPQPSRFQVLCAKLNLSRWTAISGPLVNVAASILDICDRPFVRINRITRLILGWLSLAFATAALAMLLFMVF